MKTNLELMIEALQSYNPKRETNFTQYIYEGLKYYLKKSKHLEHLTDELLLSQTLKVLSGDYDPNAPIDLFLHPVDHIAIDILTCDFYAQYGFIDRRRGLIIHDKTTDTYTQLLTNPFTTYPITNKSALSMINSEGYPNSAVPLNIRRPDEAHFIASCGVVLKNFDKLTPKIKIDPNYQTQLIPAPTVPLEPRPKPAPLPPSSTVITDEPLPTINENIDFDGIEHTITDELLAELKELADLD